MITDILRNKAKQLKEIFSEVETEQIARRSGFIQRSDAKLNPFVFLMVMIVEMSKLGPQSLLSTCELMVAYGGARIRAQALSRRLGNLTTVIFFRHLYAHLLRVRLRGDKYQVVQEGIISRFNNIYLEDSTSCGLDEAVSGSFKGSGGSSSKAAYKIHTIWNASKRDIKDLKITSGNTSDQSQAFNIIPFIKQNDLVYDKRIRKAKRKAQKNGRTLGKAVKRLARFCIFITNLPQEKLKAEEVSTLYRLRWDIEVLFKVFKGDLQVHMIKGKSRHRVECFILAKLIAIISTATLHKAVYDFAILRFDREISFTKFMKYIHAHKYLLIMFTPTALKYNVMEMLDIDIVPLCKQKRARKTTQQLLEMEAILSDIYPDISDLEPLKVIY